MRFDDMLHNGQAKPGTSFVPGSGLINPKKTLRDSGNIFGIDSNAGVAYKNGDFIGFLGGFCDPDGDGAARFVVFDAVFDEVDEDLADLIAVDADLQISVEFLDDDLHFLFLGFVLKAFGDFEDEATEVERADFRFEFACFEPRDLHQVFSEVGEAIDVAHRFTEKLFVDLVVVDSAVDEGFDKALDGEDWGFEFVRDVADELFPVVFDFVEPLKLFFHHVAGAYRSLDEQAKFIAVFGDDFVVFFEFFPRDVFVDTLEDLNTGVMEMVRDRVHHSRVHNHNKQYQLDGEEQREFGEPVKYRNEQDAGNRSGVKSHGCREFGKPRLLNFFCGHGYSLNR